jgi:hypothetical protein
MTVTSKEAVPNRQAANTADAGGLLGPEPDPVAPATFRATVPDPVAPAAFRAAGPDPASVRTA